MARVLIMDDEPAICRVLKIALCDAGHEVITVTNGAAGLEILGKEPAPEVVVVDLFMPNLTGRSVVEKMSADSRLRSIPIVIITGSLPTDDILPPRSSYRALFHKPFDLLEVLDAVSVLARSENADRPLTIGRL
ncbi:MAG: response regulator [Solirubrobacterales bacterium]